MDCLAAEGGDEPSGGETEDDDKGSVMPLILPVEVLAAVGRINVVGRRSRGGRFVCVVGEETRNSPDESVASM